MKFERSAQRSSALAGGAAGAAGSGAAAGAGGSSRGAAAVTVVFPVAAVEGPGLARGRGGVAGLPMGAGAAAGGLSGLLVVRLSPAGASAVRSSAAFGGGVGTGRAIAGAAGRRLAVGVGDWCCAGSVPVSSAGMGQNRRTAAAPISRAIRPPPTAQRRRLSLRCRDRRARRAAAASAAAGEGPPGAAGASAAVSGRAQPRQYRALSRFSAPHAVQTVAMPHRLLYRPPAF